MTKEECHTARSACRQADALTCAGAEAVAALPNLAELDIGSCERVDCGTLRALSRLNRLRSLRLAGCSCIRDEGLQHLARGCTALCRCHQLPTRICCCPQITSIESLLAYCLAHDPCLKCR